MRLHPLLSPNAFTALRLLLTPVVLWLLLDARVPFHFLWAGIVFVVAMTTDVIDGCIARRYNLITRLGNYLDPLADKLLINLMLFALVSLGLVPFWLAAVLFARDILSSDFKSFAAVQKVHVSFAPIAGKMKALLQTAGITLFLVALAGQESSLVSPAVFAAIAHAGLGCLIVALCVGLYGLARLLLKSASLVFRVAA